MSIPYKPLICPVCMSEVDEDGECLCPIANEVEPVDDKVTKEIVDDN